MMIVDVRMIKCKRPLRMRRWTGLVNDEDFVHGRRQLGKCHDTISLLAAVHAAASSVHQADTRRHESTRAHADQGDAVARYQL